MVDSTSTKTEYSAYSPMQLIKKLYQRSIWPAAIAVAKGTVLTAPIVVDLDPTTVCDLACPECISGSVLNKGGFSSERLESLVSEIADAGVRAVILIGGGEPLAHKGIDRAIEFLKKRGLHIGLVTNGTLLGRHLDVVAANVDWVRISVDAATAATYQLVRPSRHGRNMFFRILRNMLEFSDCKAGALGYSFVTVFRKDSDGRTIVSNVHEISKAARIAKRAGCDYFELKAAMDLDHFIIQESPEHLDIISDELAKAEILRDANFQIHLSSSMVALLKKEGRVQEKAYEQCFVAELRTLITPSGVYICPYHRGNQAFRLGDAMKEPLQQIWQASSRSRVNPKSACLFHCARHETNLALSNMDQIDHHSIVTDDYDLFL